MMDFLFHFGDKVINGVVSETKILNEIFANCYLAFGDSQLTDKKYLIYIKQQQSI